MPIITEHGVYQVRCDYCLHNSGQSDSEADARTAAAASGFVLVAETCSKECILCGGCAPLILTALNAAGVVPG